MSRIKEYYEIDRIIHEIHTIVPSIIDAVLSSNGSASSSSNISTNNNTIATSNSLALRPKNIRIAIQLPDELLHDGPILCQLYDQLLNNSNSISTDTHHHTTTTTIDTEIDIDTTTTNRTIGKGNGNQYYYSIYLLGDTTTYAPCCPDIIAAQHIIAHFLIHYGHTCFSYNTSSSSSSSNRHQSQNIVQFPIVLYSFNGIKQSSLIQSTSSPSSSSSTTNMSIQQQCVHDVYDGLQQKMLQQSTNSTTNVIRLLVLYEVQYSYMITDIVQGLHLHHHSKQQHQGDNDTTTMNLSIKVGTLPKSFLLTENNKNSNVNNNNNNYSHINIRNNVTTIDNVDDNNHNVVCCVDTATIATNPTTACCKNNYTNIDQNHQHPNCSSCSCTTTLGCNCKKNDSIATSIPEHNTASASATLHTKTTTTSRRTDPVTSDVLINEIQDQYHNIIVGGLELPYPFSSKNNDSVTSVDDNIDNNDDDIWVNNKEDDLNDYILLYIGQDTSRPFLNIVLRFLSMNNSNNNINNAVGSNNRLRLSAIWTWTPTTTIVTTSTTQTTNDVVGSSSPSSRLCTNVLENSSSFQKILQRRYYLIQKAKQCTIFGIIIAYMTPTIQSFVSNIQQYLNMQEDITYYTFVVGKINPTKLANYPEVQCFIFVACPEHSLLHNERELYHVPIITPYELLIVFGSSHHTTNNDSTTMEWGDTPYSTYPSEYWNVHTTLSTTTNDISGKSNDQVKENRNGVENDEDEDDDAPYFSLVSGKYETRTKKSTLLKNNETINDSGTATTTGTSTAITTRIGNGTITNYGSNNYAAASNFLKQREYQGLVPMQPPNNSNNDKEDNGNHTDIGTNDDTQQQQQYTVNVVQPAVLGQTGIASNYRNR